MGGNESEIRICEIRDAGRLKAVESLAWKIFPKTYEDLLPAAQIPYMMRMMYDGGVLRKEFASGVKFALILEGDEAVGYLSWHPVRCDDGTRGVKLEKLYLDFARHGRGIGNLALRFVLDAAVRTGASRVLLNVNKGNLRAQKAYLRAGFTRWRSEKNPIGGGYFMDDYVMRCDLAPDRPAAGPKFRPLRRCRQQLSEGEAREVLARAKRGVLSVTGDDGWPYGVWLNHHYRAADGRIYFHGAKEGHKIDALRRDGRACFTVIDEGVRDEGGWAYTFRSVAVFGRIEFVEDRAFALELCRELARRFNPCEEDIEKEIRTAGARVQVLCLIPEHISGKSVHEA